MAEIPPWLYPPNFLQAAESGARIGTERAAQAAQALESAGRLSLASQQEQDSVSEAGDRLRLAYSQLASNERQASQAAKARLAQQNAAMALRAQQQQALDSYRQQMAQTAAERLRLQQTPDNPFKPSTMKMAGHDLIQLGPNRWQISPDAKLPPAPKPNPADVAKIGVLKGQILQMSKAMETADEAEKNQIGLAMQGAMKQLEDLGARMSTGGAGTALQPGATHTGTAAPSPYKEGQLLKNKKDGKTYRIQNGVPVLAESAGASLSAHDDEEPGDGY